MPYGTGFFVGVLDATGGGGHAYLATAKHVLFSPSDQKPLTEIYLRLNTKDDGAEVVRVRLSTSGENRNVFLDSDPATDLALVAIAPNADKASTQILPSSFLATRAETQKMGIGDGSDVFFTGLFVAHVGEKRNYPITRFGRVALLSEEPIDFINYKGEPIKADLMLIEAQSYGGNSGSPVFYYIGSDREPGSLVVGAPILKLAGVMSGSFSDMIGVKAMQSDAVAVVTPNNGIAAVVPAYKLLDLLMSEEVAKARSANKPIASPSP